MAAPLAQLVECQTLDRMGGVVCLSKTLHLHCLVLVQPMKNFLTLLKIVDWDVKPQPK